MKQPDRWFTCPGCQRELSGTPLEGGFCVECDAVERLRAFMVRKPSVLQALGVPEDLRKKKFIEPDPWPRPANLPQLDLQEWFGDNPPFLTIAGPVGTGKSMLAAELLYRLVAKHRSQHRIAPGESAGAAVERTGWWCAARHIPGLLIDGGAPKRRLQRVPYLVVDDLGGSHPGGAWEHLVGLGLDREGERLTTIWTTNLTFTQIGQMERGRDQFQVPRLADRLRGGAIVALGGRSRR